MADHPELKDWQNKIKLMRARNVIEAGPANIKKEVEDKIKLLETAVDKFNKCYQNFPKQWQQLEEWEKTTKVALDALKERFNEELGKDADRYRTATDSVNKQIDDEVERLEKLRGGPAAPTLDKDDKLADYESVPEAEQALEARKKGLADIGPALKKVETLCDDIGKLGADAVKARKEAEGHPPAERPIEAWTAIRVLEVACDKLAQKLKEDPVKDAADELNSQINRLPGRLTRYRADGQKVEELKAQLKAGEATLEEWRKSRSDRVLLELEQSPPPADAQTGRPDPAAAEQPETAQTDESQTESKAAPVGTKGTTNPYIAGETKLGSDIKSGNE